VQNHHKQLATIKTDNSLNNWLLLVSDRRKKASRSLINLVRNGKYTTDSWTARKTTLPSLIIILSSTI